MQPVPSAQPWQQYVSPSCVYPSPGHSFLTILQPGYAGNGMELTKESHSSISISIACCLISWTTFHKTEFDSKGIFARVAGLNHECTLMNTNLETLSQRKRRKQSVGSKNLFAAFVNFCSKKFFLSIRACRA
jgi:hypothetical protein